MRKLFVIGLICVLPSFVLASGSDLHLRHASVDLSDQASLQRGAKYFVNYCLSCHSAEFMRYQRMADDLNISEEDVLNNLMFASNKIGDTMSIAMTGKDADNWFGTTPPDLSVIARSRGEDWLYTYLHSFYIDESRPSGVNNLVFPDVGMPHVLWELQGSQKAVFKTVDDEHGGQKEVFDHFEAVESGEMTAKEYDQAVTDLVNFMVYMGEPAKLVRYELGIKVLVFLAVFFVIAVMLKKEYWKDIH